MKAPSFTLRSTEGKSVKLSDFIGKKIIILNFCAFWCDTWQEEADGFYNLKKDFPDISFDIISVSIDGQLDMMLKKKKDLIYYPVLLDIKKYVSALYSIDNVPTLFILDKEGVIRYKFRGYPGTVTLYSSIKYLMEEKFTGVSSVKKLSITFDDFPTGEDSDVLLDILEKEHIKATFFVSGEKAEKYPSPVRRAFALGHNLGIHSYHHVDFTELSEKQMIKEISDTSDVIYKLTGKRPLLLRPPGGHVNKLTEKIAMDMNLKILLWTINPLDYQRPGRQIIAERILGELKSDKEIILLHDGVKETSEILPELISIFRDRGYEFQ
ncbi:MAG: polysaccharide deacetylase family protein [Candidatus Eremiobacterota bacterium]